MLYSIDSYDFAAAISPSDTVDLPKAARAIYVGGAGNISVIMMSGETVTFNSVPVGILPIKVKRIRSTGTTATNMIALS